MTTFIVAPFTLLFVMAHEIVSSETLVILSNVGVVGASLLLAAITVHEAHKTIRKTGDDMVKVVRSDNRLLARLIAGPFIVPDAGKHRKDDNS